MSFEESARRWDELMAAHIERHASQEAYDALVQSTAGGVPPDPNAGAIIARYLAAKERDLGVSVAARLTSRNLYDEQKGDVDG